MCSPREALYIVNSLHYSTGPALPSDALRQDPPILRDSSSHVVPLEPINFGISISPRLAAHSFLHLLLRRGSSDEAAKYAELMMQQGIRVHRSTTDAIVQSLCGASPTLSPSKLLDKLKARFPFTPKITNIPSHQSHSGIQAAQGILSCARRFGQERTERMYENLIYSCILQGELIVASLLFVLLVKDWEVYKARKDAKVQDQLSTDVATLREANHTRPQHPMKPPFPELYLFTTLTDGIRSAFSREPDDPGGEARLQEPLQALANLVALVDEGQLRSGHISSLISLLYNCPRTSKTVNIRRGGKEVSLEAYSYFHDFLSRLITTLKTPMPLHPSLDTRSCNALLHYALRHRFSPALTTDVLEHICVRLKPNTTTANILLHSGSLLRRTDITQAALDILRRSSDLGSVVADRLHSDHIPKPHSERGHLEVKGDKRLERGLKRLRQEEFKLPKQMVAFTPLSADVYTLVAFISHLTSTGRPGAVAEIVFKIFPELCTVDQSSSGKISPRAYRLQRRKAQEVCVHKAVQLGPHFFSALINALAKAGRTGLAERVWVLAQQAERASWIPHLARGVEPWLLPIHAYTSMVQCYVDEARR
ncbi:hypothetical protein BC835DRAFT_1267380, partial [Cytidiella melzeri]